MLLDWLRLLVCQAGAQLTLDGKVIARGTGKGAEAWVASSPQRLAANRQVALVATSSPGEELAAASIGVKMPDGTLEAPMTARGAADPAYQLCSTKGCDEDVTNIIPQTQATANCPCRKWSDVVNFASNSPLSKTPGACAQPSWALHGAPWCFCVQPPQGKVYGQPGKVYGSDSVVLTVMWGAYMYFSDHAYRYELTAKDKPGASWCAHACSTTTNCKGWTYVPCPLPNSNRNICHGWTPNKVQANTGGQQCTLYSKVGELVDSTDLSKWASSLTAEPSHCAEWVPKYGCEAPANAGCFASCRGNAGATAVPKSIVSGGPNDKGVPFWSYCDIALAPKPDTQRGRRLLEENNDESWLESEIQATSAASEQAETAVEGQTPNEIPTVDCVGGQSSVARENHLGNSRSTATNRKDMEAAIPHGVNANRYIWKVPEHINENCVLRLRYNISTADYFAWNNEGQPMTDARHNQNPRSRRSSSPVVQDPYLGIGANPTKSFLSLAVNTNQYGRTFQDRSYVFAIRPRPRGMSATAKIYNLNVRGKRGNIVQTYPAVEYDFVPNDLCIDKDDYIHFQWTGSDYNPQRNPNDAEGGGDSLDQNQARRADRSNIVDMDSLPKVQWRRRPSGAGYSGAGQRHAAVDSGHSYFAGALQDWKNLDKKYTGMFWGADGKPDEKTIMKMAFLDQMESLRTQGQQCLSPDQLGQLNQAQRERDPLNCAKLNAVMDKTGQRTPYFDGGLVMMRKAGRFSYIGSRNQNFSNRNQGGNVCVKQGREGTCATNAGCTETMEKELLGKFKEEEPTGKAKQATRLAMSSVHKRLATKKKRNVSLLQQLEALKAENANLSDKLIH